MNEIYKGNFGIFKAIWDVLVYCLWSTRINIFMFLEDCFEEDSIQF